MHITPFYEKIYVVHWKPLTGRKQYLLEKFKEYNLEDRVIWVDQYESEKDLINVDNFFDINKKLLAVNMSHIFCYEDQIKNGYKNVLIFEDDIDFDYLNIPLYLNICAEEFVKLDGDIAFLGSCCELAVKEIKENQLLYYDKTYGSRSTSAYIVNHRCVEKLLKCAKLNCHAIDRVLSGLIPLLGIRCLWSGIQIKQGSETGKFPSVLHDIRDENGDYKK